MTFRRWGVLLGVLCALSLGASDLHSHLDGVGYQGCAVCQMADSGRMHSRAAPRLEPPALSFAEAPPRAPGRKASVASRSVPKSRGPPS